MFLQKLELSKGIIIDLTVDWKALTRKNWHRRQLRCHIVVWNDLRSHDVDLSSGKNSPEYCFDSVVHHRSNLRCGCRYGYLSWPLDIDLDPMFVAERAGDGGGIRYWYSIAYRLYVHKIRVCRLRSQFQYIELYNHPRCETMSKSVGAMIRLW